MPPTVAIGTFVLGAVLLFVAILGGGFKLFGAEVSGTITGRRRFFAGVLAVPFLAFALIGSWPDGSSNEIRNREGSSSVGVVTASSFSGSWRNTSGGTGDPAAVTIRAVSETEAAIHMTVFGPSGVQDLGEKRATLRDDRLRSEPYFLDSVRRVELSLEIVTGDRIRMTFTRIVAGQLGTTTEDETFELRRTALE